MLYRALGGYRAVTMVRIHWIPGSSSIGLIGSLDLSDSDPSNLWIQINWISGSGDAKYANQWIRIQVAKYKPPKKRKNINLKETDSVFTLHV